MAFTARERKEKGAWEPSEDRYERTRGPASHVKNPDPAPAPRSLSSLSPASLTDKPLGACGRGAEAGEESFSVCVWRHVYLHDVCQQVSRGAGTSANSRSTHYPQVQDAHRHAQLLQPTVDAVKGATL